MKLKEILKLTGIPVLFASLCCLAPVIFVLLGFSGVAFAASLSDNLYGNYRWVFRGVGLLLLMFSLIFYFRNKGICTIDKVKAERRKIINTVLVVLVAAIVFYIFWLYVVVEIAGILLGIWQSPV